MIRPICLVLLFLLAGCVSLEERRAAFEADLAWWVGKPLDDLIQRKGAPAARAKLSDGREVVEYSSAYTEVSGGGTFPQLTPVFVRNAQGGSWIYVRQPVPLPTTSRLRACKLLFTVSRDGLIEKWSAEGNDCF